jgi:hypothetical protein
MCDESHGCMVAGFIVLISTYNSVLSDIDKVT